MGVVSIGTSGVMNGLALLGLRRAVRVRRAVASACHRLVHVGDRHRGRRLALLRVSPDGAPGPAVLGDPSGPPLQPVLQLRHRAAAEVEHQRRRVPARTCCHLSACRRGWCSPASRSTWSTSSGFTPNASGRLWRPIEFVFNTPSHHRVHHGMDQQYLDKNYGGILIVCDRLFRSFAARNHPTALRAHQTGGHVQRLDASDPRVRGHRTRRAAGAAVARPLRLRLRSARVGTSGNGATGHRGAGQQRLLSHRAHRRRRPRTAAVRARMDADTHLRAVVSGL